MEYYLETVDFYMNRFINEIEIHLNFYKPQEQMLKSLVALTSLDIGYSKHTYFLTLLVS